VKTTEQISESTKIHADILELVLRDEQRRGHVEKVGQHWRISAAAEERYGRALRDLTFPEGREQCLNVF
jgi:hypothetical protein